MGKAPTSPPAEAGSVGRRESACRAGSSMFSPEAWTQIGRSLGLSGRQLQVVRGTFDDKTELAMAADLRISPSTVHTHVEAILKATALTIPASGSRPIFDPFVADFPAIAWDADCDGEPCDAVGAGLVQADGAVSATPAPLP